MDELIKKYGNEAKTLLQDPKNQQVLLIAGAVYLLSRTSKERNAILSGLAALALLPDPELTGKE